MLPVLVVWTSQHVNQCVNFRALQTAKQKQSVTCVAEGFVCRARKWAAESLGEWGGNNEKPDRLACSAGVFFERAICSRKRHVETSRREEEMGQVKGSGEEAGREKRKTAYFFLPSPLSFFRPRTYRKGYYFYSPQSSTVIKSKLAATRILRTRTRFRPPKIHLHCRLQTGQRGQLFYCIKAR